MMKNIEKKKSNRTGVLAARAQSESAHLLAVSQRYPASSLLQIPAFISDLKHGRSSCCWKPAEVRTRVSEGLITGASVSDMMIANGIWCLGRKILRSWQFHFPKPWTLGREVRQSVIWRFQADNPRQDGRYRDDTFVKYGFSLLFEMIIELKRKLWKLVSVWWVDSALQIQL